MCSLTLAQYIVYTRSILQWHTYLYYYKANTTSGIHGINQTLSNLLRNRNNTERFWCMERLRRLVFPPNLMFSGQLVNVFSVHCKHTLE